MELFFRGATAMDEGMVSLFVFSPAFLINENVG